jgi:Domain of unknown function (DUF222)/HNH endonuclease
VEERSVLETVCGVARRFNEVLRAFDPALLSGPESVLAVEELVRTEKACAAARAMAAARAVELGAYRARGFASGPEWLASQAGSSNGEARRALLTASAMERCPEAKQALVAGELSLAQAHEVVSSQRLLPGSEHDLVALARGAGLGPLRDAVRDRVLQAVPPPQLHELQHQRRSVHTWHDPYGNIRLAVAMEPELGVPIVNRLDAEAERLRRAAHRRGIDEPYHAYLADALVSLLGGQGRGRPIRSELVVVCDLAAYRRGHAHAGEVCHLRGGGPLPVERVRELSKDAFIKAVLHDGTRIEVVKHFGRHINAELRTALELGEPPRFEGSTCAEAGCARRYGLEWDHIDPVAHGGLTCYDNLVPRCWPHHREKTERDRSAGLLAHGPP